MNPVLQNRFTQLGKEEIAGLRHRLRDSPRLLRLIQLLESRKDKKLNTVEMVRFVYEGEAEPFEVLRNRFFKLRKQLLGLLEPGNPDESSAPVMLLPFEKKLLDCRRLIAENHFQVAQRELRNLLSELRTLNIFELMPETISQLVFSCMSLNQLKDVNRYTDELEEANRLLEDFRRMQVCARRAYLATFRVKGTDWTKIRQQLRRLSQEYPQWPRFRLYYHFIVFTHSASYPESNPVSLVRHLSAMRRLMEKHPGMPGSQYELHATALMEFYILAGEAALLFNKGEIEASYRKHAQAWEIQDRIPNLRSRRSESHYTNKIAIEVATRRYKEALRTAEEFIEFQKEQRQEEKRLLGYAEIAMIYTYAWPHLVCPNADFIIRKLKEYIALLRKNESDTLTGAMATLAIFYFLNGDWKNAARLSSEKIVSGFFTGSGMDFFNRLLRFNPATDSKQIEMFQAEIRERLTRENHAGIHYSLLSARNLLNKLLKEKSELA